MVRLAAGLRHGRDEDRSFLVLGTEVSGQHLEFLQEVRIWVNRSIAVATRVRYVRAVRCDVQRIARQAIVGVGIVQRALAAAVAVGVNANDFARIIRLVRSSVLTKSWTVQVAEPSSEGQCGFNHRRSKRNTIRFCLTPPGPFVTLRPDLRSFGTKANLHEY